MILEALWAWVSANCVENWPSYIFGGAGKWHWSLSPATLPSLPPFLPRTLLGHIQTVGGRYLFRLRGVERGKGCGRRKWRGEGEGLREEKSGQEEEEEEGRVLPRACSYRRWRACRCSLAAQRLASVEVTAGKPCRPANWSRRAWGDREEWRLGNRERFRGGPCFSCNREIMDSRNLAQQEFSLSLIHDVCVRVSEWMFGDFFVIALFLLFFLSQLKHGSLRYRGNGSLGEILQGTHSEQEVTWRPFVN